MSSGILKYFALLAITLIFTSLTNAQPGTRSTIDDEAIAKADTFAGQTYAIIIGVSNYHYLKSLTYADKDAELFRDFLTSPAGGKVKNENILMLTNENATATSIWIDAFDKWISTKPLKAGDRLYIYFAGHGDAKDSREYYLLTYDSNPAGDRNNYRATGTVRMYDLKNTIADFTRDKIKVILIIDACRTDDLPKDKTGQDIYNYNGITQRNEGETLLLSASGGEKSMEDKSIGNGHGLFTWFLVDGLSGSADADDLFGNKDGMVTLDELGPWTQIMVKKTAQKFQHQQNPTFYDANTKIPLVRVDNDYFRKWQIAKSLNNSSLDNSMAINTLTNKERDVEGEKPDSSALALYNKFLKAIKDDKFSGENSAENYYDTLLARFPNSSITTDARYELASSFINFGQEKINLHLSGKDYSRAIELLKDQMGNNEESKALSNSVQRMENVVKEKYSVAAYRMEKGIALLKSRNMSFVNGLTAKAKFLKAKSYYDDNKYDLRLDTALALAREARALEPDAAYISYLLSYLFDDKKMSDSAAYYKRLTLKQAPNWVYPLNDLGIEYENHAQYDSALYCYKKAIEIDPNYVNSYYNASYIYKTQLVYDSAETYSRKAIVADPKYLYAWCNLGDIKKEQANYDSADYFYRKALEINPRSAYALNNFGVLFYNQNKTDSALKYYRKAIEADRYYYYSMLNSGLIYQDRKQYDSAQLYFEKTLDANPGYAAGFNALAINYEYLDQNDKAIENYKKAIQADEKYYYAWYNAGRLYRVKKQYDSASYFLKQAVAINPNYASALNSIGLNFEDQKQNDSAIVYYNKALSIDSNYQYGWYNLGRVYQNKKEYAKADQYIRKAISINPKYGYAYNLLGINFEELEKIDSAIYYYKKALLTDSTIYYPLYSLANLAQNQKDYANADKYARQALAINPKYTDAYNLLGLNFADQEKYDSAIYYYQQAIKIDSSFYYPLYNMARIDRIQKNLDKAKTRLWRALVIKPDYSDAYNLLGLCAEDENKADSAIYYFTKALDIDSNFFYPWYNLGRVYQNQEQYKKADECLRKAISIKPTNADALNKLGLNFDNLAIYDSAYLYYNKAVLADSSYYHSIYNMARIDRIQNNYKKAEVKLWKALSLQPNYADAYNLLGLCAEDQKKLDSSIYYYTSAIKSDSSMYYSWYNLGRVYQNQDDYKKAEPYLKQAVAIKKSQDALNILALNFENLNHLDSAYYYYIQAKEADSNYFYPWYNLGRLYQNDKKYSQAEMHLKKAISIKPQSAEALNTLGLNFENLQLMDSAIIYYQKSIKADSNYYYPWYNISLLYQDNGDYNTAIAFLKKAISLRPTSTGAYNALANAFDDMGQKDSAIKYYQKALSIDSNYIYAVYNLGRVYRNTQQLALAEKYLRKTLRINPDYYDAYNSLGLVYEDLNKVDSALMFYANAIKINPNYYYPWYNMGRMFRLNGEYNQAVTSLKNALRIDPSSTNALEVLGLAYENLNQYDSALHCYLPIPRIKGKKANEYDYYKPAEAYFNLQQYDSSIYYYKKSIAVNPSYIYSLNNLGYCFQFTGQYDSSIVYLKKCIQVDSTYYTAMANLATAFELKNQFDSAILYNEKIYNHFKDSTASSVLANLGYDYLRINKQQKSFEFLSLADRLYNNNSTKYNLCCYYSLTGNPNKALQYLEEALKLNFDNYQHIQTDKDLDPLRKEPGFTELLKKYFPDRFK